MNDTPVHPDHAQLLLYLAGELAPTEARAIETRLAGDAVLRRELDGLRSVESAVNQGLGSMDAVEPIEPAARLAERRVSRLLSQWQVDRVAASTAPAARRRVRRVPVWLYPISAAAVVMVGLGVWYLSFDRNADGTLAFSNDDSDNRPAARTWEEVDDDTPTADIELAANGADSFGELEREMSKFIAISEALQ